MAITDTLVFKTSKFQNKLFLDLEFKINDFGPIKKADIKLKKLTIFIGPNNSGKSYAALLIHSIINVNAKLCKKIPADVAIDSYDSKKIEEQILALTSDTKNLHIPSTRIRNMAQKSFDEVLPGEIALELHKNFTSEHENLIRIGTKTSSIRIKSDLLSVDIDLVKDKIKTTIDSHCKLNVTANFIKPGTTDDSTIFPGEGNTLQNNNLTISMTKTSRTLNNVDKFVDLLINGVEAYFYTNLIHRSTYFPAARSGILQSHKVITSSILRDAPYAGLKNMEIPKLSGVISDFLSAIVSLPKQSSGVFDQIIDDLERDILGGKIKTTSKNSHIPNEITYQYKNNNIPLHLTSSTVSELAPFILYLKYIIREGDILIIEEPEAHLHPGNQKLFAQFLVKLIRHGLNIVITTHSPIILEELSHSVQRNGMHSNQTDKERADQNYISPDEIAAYLFQPDSSGSHSTVALDISEEDGIPQHEFNKIYESMYEDYQKIQG